jgi:hypothetical protein
MRISSRLTYGGRSSLHNERPQSIRQFRYSNCRPISGSCGGVAMRHPQTGDPARRGDAVTLVTISTLLSNFVAIH